jgi:hypothetical protein
MVFLLYRGTMFHRPLTNTSSLKPLQLSEHSGVGESAVELERFFSIIFKVTSRVENRWS